MRYAIISGSHRENSQSSKVSQWLAERLKDNGDTVDIIDLKGNPIPLWDQSAWDGDSNLSKKMAPYLEKVTHADALILVAPEWAGMVAAGLKNFLIYFGVQHAAHKPTLLVGVSASRGGTYPIAELRMSGYKNARLVYIPDHLIIQDVENVMNDPDPEKGSDADIYIKKRALYSLDVLGAYAKSLKTMRDNNTLLREEYPFGM